MIDKYSYMMHMINDSGKNKDKWLHERILNIMTHFKAISRALYYTFIVFNDEEIHLDEHHHEC